MTVSIDTPLRLPSGVTLPNRLVKAAMTEGLADTRNNPTERHARLYRRWAEGGIGLLITGNMMVDRRYLEQPGNIALEPDVDRTALARMASAATTGGTHCWVQLSHAGRQTPKAVAPTPVAPSAVTLDIMGQFGQPRALGVDEIEDVIRRFAFAAKTVREAGFTGVQIHSAHGYLLSQFLSPVTNRRTDEWGGALENRARLLLEVVRAVRATVGSDFSVAVKLNSADFQKGGFSAEECLQVVRWLNEEKLDLLEISGGSYEQPAMMGVEGDSKTAQPVRESTRKREAYFLDYAAAVKPIASMPLMVTGGLRSRAGIEAALADGIDLVGIGRPLCAMPEAPRALIERQIDALPRSEDRLRIGPGWLGPRSPLYTIKALNAFANIDWFYVQIIRMGDGLDPDPNLPLLKAFLTIQLSHRKAASRLDRTPSPMAMPVLQPS